MVFIGQDIDQDLLTKTLDAVLLDDKEWKMWEKVSSIMSATLDDGWPTAFEQVMGSRRSEEKKVERLHEIFDGELTSIATARSS